MATTLRNDAKQEIINILRDEGYATYARLADLFDIYLTDDPNVVGYMIPGKAKIVLNQNLSISQVSLIIRHEILHEFLTHRERQTEVDTANKGKLGSDHELANIAGDYEISNRGYTDRDKANARAIVLGDKVLRGLVTEDEYPDWEDKTFEEMYNELLKKREKDKQALEKLLQQLQSISQKELEDLMDELNGESGDGPDMDGIPQDADGEGKESESKDDPNAPTGTASGAGKPQDKSTEEKVDKIKKALKQAAQDAKDLEDESKSDGSVFDSDKSKKEQKDLAKRVAEIKRIFQDLKEKEAILDNSAQVKSKEKAIKAAREIQKVQSSPLNKFKLSLTRFIADQLEEQEEETYARVNPSYEDTEFLLPGRMNKEEKHIPSINVYWDVSGSFPEGSEKTKMAERAIAAINTYVNSGDITTTSWYFADRVSSTRSGAGGGTRGTPILEHVKQTKPTNVIVITDDDISDCHEVVKVPGAVWYLFFGRGSENIASHLVGKRQTRSYVVNI